MTDGERGRVEAGHEGRVRAFWERGFNGRDLGVVDAITAPGFVNRNALPGTPPGPEGHRQVVQRLWEALPDGRFAIEHLAAAGDTVICVGTMSGTHAGTLLGVPATGRPVAWRQACCASSPVSRARDPGGRPRPPPRRPGS